MSMKFSIDLLQDVFKLQVVVAGQMKKRAEKTAPACPCLCTGPKDHISIRISHSGSKAQYKEDARNHVLWDPHVCVVWGPGAMQTCTCLASVSTALTPKTHELPHNAS